MMFKSHVFSMSYLTILSIFTFLLSVACDQREEPEGMVNLNREHSLVDAQNTEDLSKADLSQQLPLEVELSSAERERYLSVLNGIYDELTVDEDSPLRVQQGDPTESCDRCGRETGFLPDVDLTIDQFLHVEMKALTFGLISWVTDLELVREVIFGIFGEEAPETLELSYRLHLVRVDMNGLSDEMAELAASARLLSTGSPEAISITSVYTRSEEIGVNFDHGFSYLLFVNAVEVNTKLSSFASSPSFIHCFRADFEQDNGGCVQLTSLIAP